MPGQSKNLQPENEMNWKLDSGPSFQWNAQSLGIGASAFLEGENRFMDSDQPNGWTGVGGEDVLEELNSHKQSSAITCFRNDSRCGFLHSGGQLIGTSILALLTACRHHYMSLCSENRDKPVSEFPSSIINSGLIPVATG